MLAAGVILIIAMFVHIYLNPFRNPLLNKLESMSLFTNIVILMVGNVFIGNQQSDVMVLMLTVICIVLFVSCSIILIGAAVRENLVETSTTSQERYREQAMSDLKNLEATVATM